MSALPEAKDRHAIRDLLKSRRRDLTEELRARLARIREDGSNTAPPKETDEGEAGDVDVEMVEILSGTLRRIELAIVSLDNGHYGWCTRCRGRISEARLRALPFAVWCRECEASREREAFRDGDAEHERPIGRTRSVPRQILSDCEVRPRGAL